MSKIIIITGSSGSGKTTIAKQLLAREQFNLKFSISACSRKKRTGEIDGVDYMFLDLIEFKNKIKHQDFLEWEEVYKDNFYGTLKSETKDILNSGHNILFDVDVKGAVTLKNYFNEEALFIFVKPPSLGVLKNRLIQRKTETEHDLKSRIDRIDYEMDIGKQCDKFLLNDNLDIAVKDAFVLVNFFLDI
jgi:guanylate kinase